MSDKTENTTPTTETPATTVPTYKPGPNENTKKTVSGVLENAVLRIQNYLMDADPNLLKRFKQVFDKTKREITARREGNDSLKRVYPVETEARLRVLRPLLDTQKEVTIESLASMDESQGWLSMVGWKLRSVTPTLLAKELPIISILNEEEMKKNIYLGVSQNDK